MVTMVSRCAPDRGDGPPTRRRVLQLAGMGLVVAPLAACIGRGAREDDDPLRALGAVLRTSVDAELVDALPADLRARLTDADAVRRELAREADAIRADFDEHRTLTAQGWLLAEREAAILVSYAGG